MKRLTKEQVEMKLEEMQDYLTTQYSDEPQELLNRLEYLTIMVADSGKLLADAKYLQDEIIGSTIVTALKESVDLPASTLNMFVKSKARDYNFLVSWAERVNSSCVHAVDSLRTQISFVKAQMSYQ